jgi:hypothetical protein
MQHPPQKHRIIIEEHGFAAELKAIAKGARQADEFIDAAKWVLCREPLSGTRIGKTSVYFLPYAGTKPTDAVVLYYTFDEDNVYLLSIRKTVYPPKAPKE